MKPAVRKISIPFTYWSLSERCLHSALWTIVPHHRESLLCEASEVWEGTLSAEIQGAIKPVIPAAVKRNYVWTSKGKRVLPRMPSFAIKRFWTLIRTFAQQPSNHSERRYYLADNKQAQNRHDKTGSVTVCKRRSGRCVFPKSVHDSI